MKDALVYKMIMALNAADIGDPICAQAASICAEIADQHCAEVHRAAIVPVLGDPVPGNVQAGAGWMTS